MSSRFENYRNEQRHSIRFRKPVVKKTVPIVAFVSSSLSLEDRILGGYVPYQPVDMFWGSCPPVVNGMGAY